MAEDSNSIIASGEQDLSKMIEIENEGEAFIPSDDKRETVSGSGSDDRRADTEALDQARREAVDARKRADDLEDRLKKETASREAADENATIFRNAFGESLKGKLEGDIKDMQRNLAKAKEEGDTHAEIEAQSKIDDLKRERDKVVNQVETAKKAPIVTKKEEKVELVKTETRVNSALQEWLKENPWFNAPKTEEEIEKKRNVLAFDEILRNGERKDNYSPDFYKEINKRLNQKMEKAKGGGGSSAVVGSRSTDRPTDTNGDQNITKLPNGKTKVTITNRDKEIMQELRLDPTNPKHLQRFALEKLRTAQREDKRDKMN